MPKRKTIPITLALTPEQIEVIYDRLLEEDPEAARRIAGRKLTKLLYGLNLPDFPEAEVEQDVNEAISAIRGKK